MNKDEIALQLTLKALETGYISHKAYEWLFFVYAIGHIRRICDGRGRFAKAPLVQQTRQ